jgi:glucose/arabinose dehydrogenase
MRAKLDKFSLVDKKVIFQAEPFLDGSRHFGGRIEFDKDGYLYLTVGERGTRQNAQKLENHAGKIIRIYDDGSIPNNNPFLGVGNVKPEIYTYGNRNPQGMAMHPVTGDIWTHEHGPMGGDEINIVKPGVNYGWPLVSYGKNYDGSIISENPVMEGVDDPIHYWDPSIAPSGMIFVTSDLYPFWQGNLLVGSLKLKYLSRLELDGEQVVHEERMFEGIGRVRAITQGPDGLIYFSVEKPGMVLKLIPERK